MSRDAAVKAVLFDLGNTLVRYYGSDEFPPVLRRCLRECAGVLRLPEDIDRDEALFESALRLNKERSDFRVRPIEERLRELFGPHGALDADTVSDLTTAFLK